MIITAIDGVAILGLHNRECAAQLGRQCDCGSNNRKAKFVGKDAGGSILHNGAVGVTKSASSNGGTGSRQRVLLVASAGGHWIELARLARAFCDLDCCFLSTASGLKSPVDGAEVIVIPDFSRHSLFVGLGGLFQLYREIRRFDPDVVISTGAAPGAFAIVLAKLRGTHTVWIDSLANYDGLSLSARAVRPFCDRMITQWPHLASRRKRIKCWGRII